MKRLLSILTVLAILVLASAAAFAQALPVESPETEELHSGMTFASVADEESIQIAGPTMSKAFIEDYLREHPEIFWEVNNYLYVYDLVRFFEQAYPEAENYSTYDISLSGIKKADLKGGYCVTFHQNLAEDTPFDGYTELEYAAMVAIAMRELNTDRVYVGYYGNPEISFVCMDKETALRFAVRNNQNSIYCVTTDETLMNPKWNRSLNPIRGIK